MRRSFPALLPVWLAASLTLAADATHPHGASAPRTKNSGLLPGLGSYHRPIATKSPQAQRLFDQGLTLIYGFNHDEAIRSFEKAAKLDPEAAMPLWGIAYALGPNYNLPVDPEGERKAYRAAQKALAVAAQAPPSEKDFVEALAKRYSDEPQADLTQLAQDYARAMGEVMRRHPEDLDAATLYAEAMMDLRPWKLYDHAGNPAEGTEEIVAVLESVLKRDPMHPGANHYYIHAVEASRNPERALPSAQRLQTLVPGAGHLVHMPAHIYARTGDYAAAVKSNADAAQVDRDTMKVTGVKSGIYPLMYYGHNLHFLAYAAAMDGRYAEAKRAAGDLAALLNGVVKEMPMAEFALPTPFLVDLQFQKWGSILASPEPDAHTPTTRALWHFARGVALASQGKPEQAETQRKAFQELLPQIPQGNPFSGTGLATSQQVLEVAGHIIDARIAAARGDRKGAIESWKQAVKAQDQLAYDEPPAWLFPVRESLGGELLRSGESSEAEKVFREDLEKHPRNPRSLFGLAESLKAQGKTADAGWVQRQFKRAWMDPASSPSIGSL